MQAPLAVGDKTESLGVEAIPAAKDPHGPRSKLGRLGMRGVFKPRGW